MKRVVVHIESANEVFAAIKTEWRELFAAARCSVFLSWEWMSVWFESFGDNRTPFILKACRDGKLIGILPMYLEKRRILGMRFNRLSLMGEGPGGADYLDLIAKPDDRDEALSAIFDFLQRERKFDIICLGNLAADSGTVRFLKNLSRTKSSPLTHFNETVTAVCPHIDLTGGWDAVLAQSKRSSNFSRKLKKLERMNGFEYRSITSADETGEAFERFLRLHEKRWLKEGGSELSGHPRLISFQRRLVEQVSRAGLIRFDELWVDGECRSSVYGLDDGQTFYYYNSGFDPEYSHLSVGLVLLGLSVQNAIGRGNSIYDFLRGDEAYKFDWANRRTNLVTISLHRNTFPVIASEGIGRAWLSLRNISKFALPAGIAEMLKGWWRARKRIYQLSD